MAYFETRMISGFIWQIRKRGNFSFLKPGRFQVARCSALHNTENGANSKKPKNETRPISTQNRDRLVFGSSGQRKKPRQ